MGARRRDIGAVGGEATPQAVESISNLRTLKQPIHDAPLTEGVNERVRLPETGYSKIYRMIVRGTLNVDSTNGAPTLRNPADVVANISYSLQSATRFHTIPGRFETLLNRLDTNEVSTPRVVASADDGENEFYVEYRLLLTYSEANLFGLVYKGGGSTYPIIEITPGRITDVVNLNGGVATLSNLNLSVHEERIDAEAPLPPRVVVVGEGENAEEIEHPAEGLWRETSSFIETLVADVKDVNGPGRGRVMHDFERGLPYLRILMLAFRDGEIDTEDTIIGGYRLVLENTTTVVHFDKETADMDYRETYHHERPGGFHVLTFRDKTASDRDIMYTAQLGRMQLYLDIADTAPQGAPESNYVELVTQRMVPLESPAAY